MASVARFAARARALHALRSRDFRLLWLGQTVSLIGDSAFLIALAWKTVSFTHSKGSLGFVLMANAAAMLTTLLIGGALADRYSRRRLMIASDLVRAGVVAGLATVDATGHLSLTWLIVFAAAVGLGDGSPRGWSISRDPGESRPRRQRAFSPGSETASATWPGSRGCG